MLPRMGGRVAKELWETICLSIDKTGEFAGSCITVPARASQQAVSRGSKFAWGGFIGTTKLVGKGVKGTGKGALFVGSKIFAVPKKTGRFIKKVFSRK